MNLKEQINSDFKEAFKAKEEIRLSALKMVKAAISNAEIEKRTKKEGGELSDEEVMEVILREAKKRKDSIVAFEDGGRAELAEGEKAELEVLQVYLPAQMSEGEIQVIVKKAIEESGAKSVDDFGSVMKVLAPQIKGKADGKVVSGIVRDLLAK